MPHDRADRSRPGPRPQFLGAEDADVPEDAFLYHVQQVEKPQAEGDIGVDKVRKAEHQEVDADVERGRAAKKLDAGLEGKGGDEVEVVMQGVGAVEQEGQQQAAPHDGVAKKGFEAFLLAVVLDHGEGDLGQRKNEPFVVNPLAAQDGYGRDNGCVKCRVECKPAPERLEPDVIGDGRAFGALVKCLYRDRIVHHHPIGQKRVD